jgi:hypothetical protein
MFSPFRQGLVAALLIGCQSVSAQTSVPPTVTVQQLAPQLVPFAGSQANFQNLVTGLAQGTEVQLFTVLPDGSIQVVNFTPTAVPVSQIPSLLESTRQQLIGLGIATPTAQQLALALTGGAVPPTLAGENRPSAAVQTQSHVTPGVNAATGATNAAAAASAEATARVNTSDSPLPPGATSRTPVPSTPTTPGPAAVATPPASSASATAAHSSAPGAVGAGNHAR